MDGLAVLQCNNPEETRCCLIGACYLTPVADAPVRLRFSVDPIRHDLGAPSRNRHWVGCRPDVLAGAVQAVAS